MSGTVLIVGATSSLGTALRPRLASTMSVITAGRQGCDIAVDLHAVDEPIVLPSGLHAVVHLAAHFGGSSGQALADAIAVNGQGTLRLCAAAAEAGAEHFIYVSSIFALAEPGTPAYGAYAATKRLAEDVARLVSADRGLALGILRPSAIYGPQPGLRAHQPFLYRIIDHAREGRDVVLFGSHDPRRNYVHVDDVAGAIHAMLVHRAVGTFTCQFPRDVTYGEVARTAFSVFGNGGQVIFDETKPDIPDNVFPIDEALQRMTGFRPRMSLEEGLRAMTNVS